MEHQSKLANAGDLRNGVDEDADTVEPEVLRHHGADREDLDDLHIRPVLHDDLLRLLDGLPNQLRPRCLLAADVVRGAHSPVELNHALSSLD